MICNGHKLIDLAPIKNMVSGKIRHEGVSYGLGEAGYDIRIKQAIRFVPMYDTLPFIYRDKETPERGRFVIASAIEEFDMPPNLTGIVHDKSTWARRGLSVFNTVIEPGWRGFLTLELVYHGQRELIIPAGAGIAQVIFHRTEEAARYTGRYQDQHDDPVPAKAWVE